MKMLEYRIRILFGNSPTKKSAEKVLDKHFFLLKKSLVSVPAQSLTDPRIWMTEKKACWCDSIGYAITLELDDVCGIFLTVNHEREPWIELVRCSNEDGRVQT